MLKNSKKHFVFLFTLSFMIVSQNLKSQSVETVAGPNPKLNNGLVVDAAGNIYASDLFGNGFDGTRIYKITPSGESELIASGLAQPAGLVFDAAGLLYVAEFSNGRIRTVDSEGNVENFVSGLSQPADLAFDADGNLYVSNYGNGTIRRITPDGSSSLFTSGLGQPVGITFDEEGFLYTASLNNGNIHKIDTEGNKTLLATIPENPVGFMTFGNGLLYLTATGTHKIYTVSLNGEVSVLTGTGIAGTVNGDLQIAQFTNPDGIAISSTGDTLYVSENNSNLLRRIILGGTTGISETSSEHKNSPFNLKLSPNPFNNIAEISYELKSSAQVNLSIFDSRGKMLIVLIDQFQQEGGYTIDLKPDFLTKGIYYFHLNVDNVSEITKCVKN